MEGHNLYKFADSMADLKSKLYTRYGHRPDYLQIVSHKGCDAEDGKTMLLVSDVTGNRLREYGSAISAAETYFKQNPEPPPPLNPIVKAGDSIVRMAGTRILEHTRCTIIEIDKDYNLVLTDNSQGLDLNSLGEEGWVIN